MAIALDLVVYPDRRCDYVSGARTNYRNSMCPASGYVTARKNCCKPICPAPGKIRGSDCVLYIICPASVDVTVRKNYRKSIYPAGARPKNMSQWRRRCAENTLKYLFAKIHANSLEMLQWRKYTTFRPGLLCYLLTIRFIKPIIHKITWNHIR